MWYVAAVLNAPPPMQQAAAVVAATVAAVGVGTAATVADIVLIKAVTDEM